MRWVAARLLRELLRRTWVIAAITVVVCAAFAARAAAALVDADYLTPVPRGALPPRPPPPAPPRLRPKDGPLVDRNPFCSSCAPDAAPGQAPGLVLPGELIATDIDREARATVRVPASQVQGSWGVGDAIPGLGRVERIAPTWIEIVDGVGRRGRLSLREAAGGARGTAMPESTPAADAPPLRVRKIDDQTYEVERSLVRDLVTGAQSARGVRPVPVLDHGEIKGIQLFGVGSGTIPFELGLRNRDTLTAIDGVPLKSAQQLFDLYAKLDQLSSVELSGTRGGEPLVRTLRLR